jgi:hypothetical protein
MKNATQYINRDNAEIVAGVIFDTAVGAISLSLPFIVLALA